MYFYTTWQLFETAKWNVLHGDIPGWKCQIPFVQSTYGIEKKIINLTAESNQVKPGQTKVNILKQMSHLALSQQPPKKNRDSAHVTHNSSI